MSPTGVSLRRRLPSPENDTSFFPSESIHDGEDLKRQVPSCASVSTSTCNSPSVNEKLKDEASYNEADEDESSCADESDYSESKSSVESAEDEDDESVLGENLIGRKVLVCPMADDDSVLDSLGDDQSLKEDDDEELMGEDDDELSSSSSEAEDDSTHDPEDDLSGTEKISRIPRSFIVGKRYYGTKQPRSFDSDDMSHDCSSIGSDSTSSSSSEEGARGLGLALDDALSALSDGSHDKEQTEFETSGAEEDDVSSVFESDENTVSNDNALQGFQAELDESNDNVFVSMEDELKQALIENKNDDMDDDNIDIGLVISREHEESSRIAGRKDSISIEDLEEIINESSSSDSEIDFSDDEDEEASTLTKDAKTESQHSKIKRQLSEGQLSSENFVKQGSFTSLKRLRSSSESSSSIENEENISRQNLLISDSSLPPLPWLSLNQYAQSPNTHSLSPQGEIYEKEYQNQIEFELSEELNYNKSKAPNEYLTDTVPLL